MPELVRVISKMNTSSLNFELDEHVSLVIYTQIDQNKQRDNFSMVNVGRVGFRVRT